MRNHINQLTDLATALSDPNRVRLLAACFDDERCVCQLVELLDLSNASISKHLAVLRRAGLLESRKEARWVHYRVPVSPPALVVDALRFVRDHAFDDEAIRKDKIKLEQIDEIEPVELARMQREGCCVNWDCCAPKPKGELS
jgi:ArsR family transcriptional regulator, arsenate/arsenite/antimonite-responsive transcriptional repressor